MKLISINNSCNRALIDECFCYKHIHVFYNDKAFIKLHLHLQTCKRFSPASQYSIAFLTSKTFMKSNIQLHQVPSIVKLNTWLLLKQGWHFTIFYSHIITCTFEKKCFHKEWNHQVQTRHLPMQALRSLLSCTVLWSLSFPQYCMI